MILLRNNIFTETLESFECLILLSIFNSIISYWNLRDEVALFVFLNRKACTFKNVFENDT